MEIEGKDVGVDEWVSQKSWKTRLILSTPDALSPRPTSHIRSLHLIYTTVPLVSLIAEEFQQMRHTVSG